MEANGTPRDRTLRQPLDAYRDEWVCSVPPDRVEVYEAFISRVEDSGVTAGAARVGDAAPMFELPNAAGDIVSLSTLLTQGPVVLIWYRGNW